jgi:hypothetical protein
MCDQSMVGAADIFKRSRPSTARISHATVFHVPGCDAGVFQRIANMAGVGEAVFGAPVTAVDEEDDGMGTFSIGKAYFDKLVGVLAVGKTQIRIRRFLLEEGFALHAEQYRTAPLVQREVEQAMRTCSSWQGDSFIVVVGHLNVMALKVAKAPTMPVGCSLVRTTNCCLS